MATSNKFKTKKFMQSVADAISKGTGCKNNFSMKDYDVLIYDFALGCSYLTNQGGNGLYFSIVDSNGNFYGEITSINPEQFIRDVILTVNRCKSFI